MSRRSLISTVALTLAASGLIGLAACSPPASQERTVAQTNSSAPVRTVVRGRVSEGALIGERWCNSCHTVSSTSAAADIGPTWTSIANDPTKTTDYLKTFLAAPHWPMDNISLSRQEIADVVAYIESL